MKITFAGGPLTLDDNQPKVGDKFKGFELTNNDLETKTYADVKGKKFTVISFFPSIDTGVCDMQTKKFAEELKGNDDVSLVSVSVDLPFAQKRWCGANTNTVILSDYKTRKFLSDNGLLIKELVLAARGTIVVDADDKIVHFEIVNEVTDHPDYDSVLKIVK